MAAKRLTLEIELGNAEMQSGEHVADALRKVADTLEPWSTLFSMGASPAFPEPREIPHGPFSDNGSRRIHDVNGNTVGYWRLS